MPSLILGRDRAETREELPDDTAAVRGIVHGAALSLAFYVAVALIWWLA